MAGTALPRRLRPVPWLQATVRELVDETPRARTLVLEVDGWTGHRAGHHVDIRLTAEDGYQAERSYSIGSAPEDELVRITVGLVEDGEVSPYLARDLQVGDTFELRGPIGGYFTWSADEPGPLLLVAGGIGLVPLMAMLRHRAAHAATVQAHLLVSARAPDDVCYRDELKALEPMEGLRVAHTYTREQPPGWTGWSGRVNAEMLAAASPGPHARCFVCGPTPFVEVVNDLLVAAGHDPDHVRGERFGPSGG